MLPSLTIPLLLAIGVAAPRPDTIVVSRHADTVTAPSADTATVVRVGAFVDGYVAYDRGRPRALDRAFTTQAARHGEFNVNLAFVDAVLTGPRVRGRVAMQAGTSVQVNYAGEPRIGATSGPDLARLLQEAWAGYEVRPGLWVDAGVFFSNVGMEGWISSDHPTYTRSLVADYSPYYSSGVRATWQATPRLTVRADVVNGWQVISEQNEDKSLGARVDFAPTPSTTVSWYALGGREVGARLRLFNGVGIKTRLAPTVDVMAALDVGREDAADTLRSPAHHWYGGSAVVRWQATPAVALNARVERYADPEQVIVVTGTTAGMRTNGASLGVDLQPAARLLWRTEARLLHDDSPIFPDRAARGGLARRNGVLLTAVTLRL
jgi:hypothetical protein